MVMRYESIRSELSLPSLQALWQNCFGILEKGAECKLHDLGDVCTGHPVDLLVASSSHYCDRCKKPCKIDLSD